MLIPMSYCMHNSIKFLADTKVTFASCLAACARGTEFQGVRQILQHAQQAILPINRRQLNQVINLCRFIMIDLPALHLFVYIFILDIRIRRHILHARESGVTLFYTSQ